MSGLTYTVIDEDIGDGYARKVRWRDLGEEQRFGGYWPFQAITSYVVNNRL